MALNLISFFSCIMRETEQNPLHSLLLQESVVTSLFTLNFGVFPVDLFIYTASPDNRDFSMLNWQTLMFLHTLPVPAVLFMKEVSEPEC